MRAEFTEEKHITLLKAPLTSSGVLFYDPELGLVRQTTKPRASTMYLNRQRLVIVDDKGRRDLALAQHPSARALVHSFVNVLRGDQQALQRDFAVRFEAPARGQGTPQWTLTLEPRSIELKGMVRQVRFFGLGAQLLEMRVAETNGDVTTLRLTRLDAKRRFSADEKQRLFTPPPK